MVWLMQAAYSVHPYIRTYIDTYNSNWSWQLVVLLVVSTALNALGCRAALGGNA